jgi:glycosyltransferase involved in cell wall biosynthesis
MMNTIFLLDAPDRDRHFQHYVLEGLEDAGFNPLVTYFTGDAASSSMSAAGHAVAGLGLGKVLYKNFNPLPVARLVRLIRKTGCRLVHVQRHRPLIYAGLACRITGTPLLYSIRATHLVRNANRRFAFNFISPALKRIIAVSKGARDDFCARTDWPPDKVTVVSNGIDISEYQIDVDKKQARKRFALPQDAFIFGMAARFKKAKDHPGLVAAFRDAFAGASPLCESGRPVMVFAGDGPREEIVRGLAAKAGLTDSIVFLGRLDPGEIPMFLRALDVFVHPSFREGMPASVLEAMAAKLPVISTDAEGVTDIFDSARDFGRMVKIGDVAAMSGAMLEMCMAGREKLAEMGMEGVERLKEGFTREHMVRGTVNVYLELCRQ